VNWQTDPTRWLTKDGQTYYLVPVSKLGYKTIEQLHAIIKREERRDYMHKRYLAKQGT